MSTEPENFVATNIRFVGTNCTHKLRHKITLWVQYVRYVTLKRTAIGLRFDKRAITMNNIIELFLFFWFFWPNEDQLQRVSAPCNAQSQFVGTICA